MYFWRTSWSIISKTHTAHSCSSFSQWPANVPMAVTLATRSNGLIIDVLQFDRSWAKLFNVIDLIKSLLAIKVWDKTLFYWMIAWFGPGDSRGVLEPRKLYVLSVIYPLKGTGDYFGSIFSLTLQLGGRTETPWITDLCEAHKFRDQSSSSSALEDTWKGCISQCNDYITLWKSLAYMNHIVHSALLEWEQILWAVWHLCGHNAVSL